MQRPILLLLTLVSAGAFAQPAPPALARERLCLGCHDVATKKVGPAFRAVAARYAGQPEAAPRLAEKVVRGGAGAWGPVPMPANAKVSPAEARQLVDWVLSLH